MSTQYNIEEENDDKKKKRPLVLILIFIIAFVAIFCGVYFAVNLYHSAMENPPQTTSSLATQNNKNDGKDKYVDNPIDFKELQKKNDEIYAWIKIDDTNVDYPIVQNKTDDSFYLKHSAEDKSWIASGAVYTELVNNKTLNDRITVIYGHNGYSDTMFTTLHYFEKADFFESHPYYYIYTEKRRLTYQVISAFKYDDRHIMNSFNFPDEAVLTDFQKMLQNPDSSLKNVRDDLDVEINSKSKITILSTCITNQKSSRYLVCGVLVKDEKTN